MVSAIALALGVNTFAGTAGTTIPPELLKVVPSDAFLDGQVTEEEPKGDPPPDLFFMNLDERTSTDQEPRRPLRLQEKLGIPSPNRFGRR